MANEKIAINVTVGIYPVRLTIDRKDEAVYRSAQQAVNTLHERLEKAYSLKSAEELWALTAFQSAIAAVKAQSNTSGEALEKLKELEDKLDQILAS